MLIQGVMFIVFAIYSRAMFIQGGTFIPESRVGRAITVWHQTDGCLDCPQ